MHFTIAASLNIQQQLGKNAGLAIIKYSFNFLNKQIFYGYLLLEIKPNNKTVSPKHTYKQN